MDRIWKSGMMAGIVGVVFALMSLVVLGAWFKVFTEQRVIFLLILLLANVLAFMTAGLSSGILVSRYARNETESLKSGLIAGCIVACFQVLFIIAMIALEAPFVTVETSYIVLAVILGCLALGSVLIAQVSLAGLISLLYTGYYERKKRNLTAASAVVEEDGLDDLKALYDDLWKDARTLVADMNRSILLYLFAGLFTLIYGFVILAYAMASWQHIGSGSADLADYAAAIGETAGGLIQIVIGPMLIRWYFKLKSRYARLTSIEKGEV